MFVLKSQLRSYLPRRGEPAWLPAAASVALVVLLGVHLSLPHGHVLPQTGMLAPRQLPQVAVQPVPQYQALFAHPLFAPDRRGGAQESAQAGGADHQLIGIASRRGLRLALVRTPQGEALTLRTGARMANWRVTDIGRDRIVLDRSGERKVLTLGPDTAPVPGRQADGNPAGATDDAMPLAMEQP